MKGHISVGFPGRQRGVVVLVFFLILFVTITTVYLTAANNRIQGTDPARNAQMLQAKDALIAFALSVPENFPGRGPGALPCPDTNNNGLPNTPCAANTPGRLPHRVNSGSGDLYISPLQPPADNQFWYAVSSNFRFLPDTILNSSSAATLTVNGNTNIVAVIIDAGPQLSGQTRPNNTVANYLEGTHIDGQTFVSGPPTAIQNDRVVTITRDELMSVIVRRVASGVSKVIQASGTYPPDQAAFATLMAGAPAPETWLGNDDWAAVSTYVFTPGTPDTATLTFTGCAIQFTLRDWPPAFARTTTQC
jgi:hypothetical protein